MTDIRTIHSFDGLVDWIGCYEGDTLIRISPVFKDNVSTLNKGCILLVDLARELTMATSYKYGRLSLPPVDGLANHIYSHFGPSGLGAINQLANGSLSPTSVRIISKQITKVARVNYVNSNNRIEQDKGRIRLDGRHVLTKFDSGTKLINLADLALYLGTRYNELETNLNKHNVAK